jgi:hypothetical protein
MQRRQLLPTWVVDNREKANIWSIAEGLSHGAILCWND